jgi:hypothetical protein
MQIDHSKHQGSTALMISRIYVGSLAQQSLHSFSLTIEGSAHQSRVASRISFINHSF